MYLHGLIWLQHQLLGKALKGKVVAPIDGSKDKASSQ
jgi:hypothetical protein